MFFTSVFPVLLTTLFRRFFQAFPFVFFPASLSGFAFLLLPPKAGPLLYLINIGPFIPVSTGVINVMNSEARQAVPFFLPLYPLYGVFLTVIIRRFPRVFPLGKRLFFFLSFACILSCYER